MMAPSKLVPARLAPARLVSRRLAPSKLAFWRLALMRLASRRLAEVRLAPWRSAEVSVAPLRSGVICGWSCLHWFQASTPARSLLRCSWFAIAFLPFVVNGTGTRCGCSGNIHDSGWELLQYDSLSERADGLGLSLFPLL